MWQKKKVISGMVALVLLAGPLSGIEAEAEVLELDSLARLFEPVSFDHDIHVNMVGENCARCHHHTLGTGEVKGRCASCHQKSEGIKVVACSDCHPAARFDQEYLKEIEEDHTRFHSDKPGLKAAYHLGCRGCHQEWGAPAGCQDCHALTETGEDYYLAGEYAPVTHEEEKVSE
ncbi:MAG: cytochrome c3 family protein [Desulfurivibrionaceae bacterium]